jgi:hypothetical protein
MFSIKIVYASFTNSCQVPKALNSKGLVYKILSFILYKISFIKYILILYKKDGTNKAKSINDTKKA